MRLTKYDWAWLKRMTAGEEDGSKSLLNNPKYVSDIKSGMCNTEIKDRWGVRPTTLGRHKKLIKEGAV